LSRGTNDGLALIRVQKAQAVVHPTGPRSNFTGPDPPARPASVPTEKNLLLRCAPARCRLQHPATCVQRHCTSHQQAPLFSQSQSTESHAPRPNSKPCLGPRRRSPHVGHVRLRRE
jgi:hypothetical protein